MLWLWLFLLFIILTGTAFVVVFLDEIIKYYYKIRDLYCVFFSQTGKKIKILKTAFWAIDYKKYSQSIAVETIFQLFKNFYEKNLKELEDSIAFEPDSFPNGKTDLYNMYKWITKTRLQNYEELNMLHYDVIKNSIEYWGQHFEDIRIAVKGFGKIEITPVPFLDGNPAHRETHYNLKVLRLQNMLYQLDNDMCNWIVVRRKHFNL